MRFKKASLVGALALALAAVGMPERAEAQQQDVGQATFGNLIAALNNINAQIRALENVDIDEVRVVNVQNVLNKNNVNAFNNALNRNNVEILNLRNVLNNNEIIKNALNNNNVAIDRVVAISVLSGGDIIVFYQPQAP